jgi:DUF177 domain-containing protein
MKFNVSSLLQEGIGGTRSYDVDSPLEVAGRDPEQVKGSVEFLRTLAGVLVRARLNLREPESCSRCLKPLDELVEVNFEEEFQATIDPRTGHPVPKDEIEADAFLIDERHILDLNEAVRQYREVSLLMQPLCRPDCKGLCSVCGADLNEGSCGHEVAAADSRWGGLAALKGLPDR